MTTVIRIAYIGCAGIKKSEKPWRMTPMAMPTKKCFHLSGAILFITTGKLMFVMHSRLTISTKFFKDPYNGYGYLKKLVDFNIPERWHPAAVFEPFRPSY